MARLFVVGSSQDLSIASAVLTDEPITMACWFRLATTGTTRSLVTLDTGTSTDRFRLAVNASNQLIANIVSSAPSTGTSTVGTCSANTWYHGAAVFAADNSRTAYLDGTAGTPETTNVVTAAAVANTRIGSRHDGTSLGQYMDGRIAEAAIWNVALTAADIGQLSDGFSPLLVRPDALRAYWPIIGRYSPELSLRGGFDLTLGNAPAAADHPRVFMPRKDG